MTPDDTLAAVVEESLRVKSRVIASCSSEFNRLADALTNAFRNGNKLLLCGNGGSASDAQHVAGELAGRFLLERRALPAIALNADCAILTALANDYSFEIIFERQIEALACPGDIVAGISTSGNSLNIVKALEAARRMGALTVGFTGEGGGKLAEFADICICAPSKVTARIQEAHITIWHALCQYVETSLFRVQ